MTKVLGIVYRYKYKLAFVLASLMVFSIGVRLIKTEDENHNVNNRRIHLETYKRQRPRNQHLAGGEDLNPVNNDNEKSLVDQLLMNNNNKPNVENEQSSINNNNNPSGSIQNPSNNNNNINRNNRFNVNKNPNRGNSHLNFNPQNQNQNQQNQNDRQQPPSGENVEFLSKLERIVHIDLKGAPPKPDYFKEFIPMLKKFGATGVLIEYEETFPFEGQLAEAKYGFAYTKEDVNMIKQLCKQNGLKLIPLVQTYGHLEWLLKIKKFAHLRENAQFPQVISPCLEESYTVLFDMLDQVISVHDDAEYFHVGCDEVYYKLQHPNCSTYPHKDFTKAFWSHLTRISSHIREKLPNVKILFWDDMMHGMDETTISTYVKNRTEIEPMMWGYMEDVEGYFQPHLFSKYGRLFGSIWIATAYKGASGELATITSIEHHYKNHLSWIDVMKKKTKDSILNFKGVALTGWSRYDHFLALCDILPEAIPSLVFNLQAIQYGELSDEKKAQITRDLGCNSQIPWSGERDATNAFVTCTFPGHEVYETILNLKRVVESYERAMSFSKLYMTPLNLEYSYIHKKRATEVMEKLNYEYTSMINYKDRFIRACDSMYWNDTAVEWLTVYFIPYLDNIYETMKKIKAAYSQNDWKPRPLPVTIKPYPSSF